MKRLKSTLCITAAAIAAATGLAACSSGITVSYDKVRPWHDGAASYEKLDYAVAVYDTTNGASNDKRVLIADGALTYTLEENTRAEGSSGFSQIDMAFSVTYNSAAAEADRGKTDTIQSSVEFHTDSLASSKMQKIVTLAERDGTENLSYTLSADYFNTHKATREMGGKTKTLSIPQNTYCDNEMMFYLARATAIGTGSSTNFYMTNIFDSFLSGSLVNHTMAASGDESKSNVELDWIEQYVVKDEEKAQAEETDEPYKLPCYRVNISISADKHGPPYCVYYSSADLKADGKTHKKVPVKITYAEYSGTQQTRITEYTLAALSFAKEAE